MAYPAGPFYNGFVNFSALGFDDVRIYPFYAVSSFQLRLEGVSLVLFGLYNFMAFSDFHIILMVYSAEFLSLTFSGDSFRLPT